MAYRVPYLQVLGPGGEDMLKVWGSALIGVRLVDRDAYLSDEATFLFTRKRPYMPIPGAGTPFTVRLGWSPREVALVGIYTFQRTHIFGAPKRGQQLHLICRAGDFIQHLKSVDTAHYDASNGFKTLGDVFRSVFKGTGKPVEIDPTIDKMPIPGDYLFRKDQSAIDFATNLAETYGGYVKPGGDKIVIGSRGSGMSASGKALPTIKVPFDENYEFDVELEPRFQYSKVAASYLDTGKGRIESEETGSGSGHGRDALVHPFPSQDAARAGAEAAGKELKRFSGTGLFSKAGDPAATAHAPLQATGYGSPIDDLNWVSTGVIHDVVPNVGWTTSIETEVLMGA